MKKEKLPSGNYRVRKTYKGQLYTLHFDHLPSDREVAIKLSNTLQEIEVKSHSATFRACMNEYIENRSNVLSPSTLNGYRSLIRQYPDRLMNKNIYDADQVFIQSVINDYAKNHSPKSVHNYHNFMMSVFNQYRPNTRFNIKLPQRIEYEMTIPTVEEFKAIIDYFEGTEYHVAIQLCALGLRRSEVCALTIDDLEDNIITINKAKVLITGGAYVIKPYTKNESSTRKIYIPNALADEIRAQGYVYNMAPNCIVKRLHKAQNDLGIARFRLHDLRHFYVSYAHELGMSDANIIKAVGHKTNHITNKVYKHAMKVNEEQERIANEMFK